MKKILLGMAVILAVSGCVSPIQYAKDGASTQDLQNDSFDCEQLWNQTADAHAYKADPLGNMYWGLGEQSYIQRCMQRKGWARVQR